MRIVHAGIGVAPNISLAQKADIATSNGIKVNTYLETSVPDVFAAGDVACFHSPQLDRFIRVEHEDNATTMGRRAGRNMAGDVQEYNHLPMFYSDLFDLGYEAVGILDTKMDVIADWQEKYKKGVLYYLDNSQIKGILLWNVWDKMDAARAIIVQQKTFNADKLQGLIA